MNPPRYFIPEEETLDRPALQALQRRKLAHLLSQLRASNAFYQKKLAHLPPNPALADLPFTTRQELEQDQLAHPPYGTNLTYPLAQYSRFHQTSGSSGRSMRILDTPESWNWFKKIWAINFAAIGILPTDRILFPFSFGPFVGFWGAFEGATNLGHLAIPAGGLSTHARLRLIQENHATIVCCTPTYAIRLAEVAAEEKLAITSIRAFIVAGEPGGNVPAIRSRIESAFNARVFDHTGMTELGPTGIECRENPGGVHIIESEFIAEIVNPQTLQPVAPGEEGELILTNLGRIACPLIRYRTNDRVRASNSVGCASAHAGAIPACAEAHPTITPINHLACPCGRHFLRLESGILGRYDDMFTVRGNNLYPSAIEALLRQNPEIAEFRVEAFDDGALTQIAIDLELFPNSPAGPDVARRVAQQIQNHLSFRADVRTVPTGTLPRFEMKAKRFIRRATNSRNYKTP